MVVNGLCSDARTICFIGVTERRDANAVFRKNRNGNI